MTIDDARLEEEFEVTGDPRLRLAQELGQVGNAQFAVLQQEDDAQPGLFADGAQGVECSFDR